MRWKGIVSQDGQAAIATRVSTTRTIQAASAAPFPDVSQPRRSCPTRRSAQRWACRSDGGASADGKLISLAAHGLDEVFADLGPQAAHAHAHDVGTGVEVVAPD